VGVVNSFVAFLNKSDTQYKKQEYEMKSDNQLHQLFLRSNLLTLCVPDEGYIRTASSALD